MTLGLLTINRPFVKVLNMTPLNKFLGFSVILIYSLVFCSCATTSPKPLTDKSEKGEIGFKFLPPQSSGWYLHEPPGIKGYAYAKQIDGLELRSAKHSVIFTAQYGFIDIGDKPQEVLKKVEVAKESQLRSSRFSVKKSQSQSKHFRGASCLIFDSLVLDKQTNQDLTLTGIFCLHPDDSKRYIDLSYSQRYDLDRTPMNLKDDGTAFVESVRFEPIR